MILKMNRNYPRMSSKLPSGDFSSSLKSNRRGSTRNNSANMQKYLTRYLRFFQGYPKKNRCNLDLSISLTPITVKAHRIALGGEFRLKMKQASLKIGFYIRSKFILAI